MVCPVSAISSVAPICLVIEAIACLIGLHAIRNRLEDQRMRSHSRLLGDVGEAFFQVIGQANGRRGHGGALRIQGVTPM
jgi:hypothetical protein